MPQRKILHLLITAVASVLSRVGGMVTILITGWYLSPGEFGVFAIAVGVTMLTLFLRGGGSGLVLQAMAPTEFAAIGGSMMRVAVIFALLGSAFTLLAIPIANSYYGRDDLASSLIWLAVSTVLFQVGTYPRAKVASEFRFEALAVTDIIASVAKLSVAVLCARGGWGPATLAVAQATASGVQLLGALALARLTPADIRVPRGWMRATWPQIRAPLGLSVLITLSTQIDTLIASLFVPVVTLGVYFFAANLASLPVQMLIGSLKSVLAPYAARARGHRALERANLEATFASGTVFVPLSLMMMAAVYPAFSHLLWGQKWSESVWPVMLGAALLIYPTIQGLLEGPVIGLRQWREYGAILFWRAVCRGFGVAVAIVVVRWFALDGAATAIVLTVGVGLAASIIAYVQIRSLMVRHRIDRRLVDFEMHSPTVYAIVGVVATRGLVDSMLNPDLRVGPIGASESAIELVLSFVIFSAISVALLRFNYLGKLKLLLALAPSPVRVLACRMLMIRADAVSALHH